MSKYYKFLGFFIYKGLIKPVYYDIKCGVNKIMLGKDWTEVSDFELKYI
ncbi:MAG: hypothetical protein ACRCZ0_06205 [Cetobacterium sp.]